MRFSELLKQNKVFILCAIVMIAFFSFLMLRHSMKLDQLENQHIQEIEDLRNLVNVTNIGKSPELEYDVYEAATEFMNLFYGVSKDVNSEYRSERLAELMTQDAFARYAETRIYDNSLDYEVTISNCNVYVNYKNASPSEIKVCIFFDESTDWVGINTITISKYWLGTFQSKGEDWVLAEITECQELLTREQFDTFVTDTDISTLESGGDEDAVTGIGTEEGP